MKYLRKYESIESNDDLVYDIIECLLDIYDDGHSFLLSTPSMSSYMSMRDYQNKNDKYDEFKPIIQTGNKIRHNFNLVFNSIDSYDNLSKIILEMRSVIGRLSDKGWIMYNLDIKTNTKVTLLGINYRTRW